MYTAAAQGRGVRAQWRVLALEVIRALFFLGGSGFCMRYVGCLFI